MSRFHDEIMHYHLEQVLSDFTLHDWRKSLKYDINDESKNRQLQLQYLLVIIFSKKYFRFRQSEKAIHSHILDDRANNSRIKLKPIYLKRVSEDFSQWSWIPESKAQ